jgi:hypothetical protein
MEEPIKITDKLFVPQEGAKKDYSSINRNIGGINDDSMWLIIEGYKDAAFELVNNLLGDTEISWLKLDSKIYPAVFLFRHFLEMILKDTIRFEKLIRQESYANEVGFPPTHSLKELWDELRPIIEARYEHFDEVLKQECIDRNNSVESLIEEIENLDGGSYAFRYPFDRPRKNNDQINYSLPTMTIELENLKIVMSKLVMYFEGINEQARVGFDEIRFNS